MQAASKECTPEIESTVSVLVNEETAAEALRSNDQKESSDNSYSIVGHQSPNTLELSVDPSLLRVCAHIIFFFLAKFEQQIIFLFIFNFLTPF